MSPQSGTYYVRERHHGRFYRSMTLPGQVSADQAEASFEHGVLTLRIPKAETMKPRRILVRSNATSQKAALPNPSKATQNGNTAQPKAGSAAALSGIA